MKNFDMTRHMIDMAVNKTLRDMRRDPERTLRNFVDLGESFSRGRFQKGFLGVVQAALAQEDSPYYLTAKHAASHIDHARLKTFGMNLGYNGLTLGARAIRAREAEEGVNFPWMITLQHAKDTPSFTTEDLAAVIEQGIALGIYCYALFAAEDTVEDLLPLLSQYGDCAFFLFVEVCGPDDAWLDGIDRYANVMTMIDGLSPSYERVAARLLEKKCLYSAYLRCTDDNIEPIEACEWMAPLVGSGSIFTVLLPASVRTPGTQARIARLVTQGREEPRTPLILIDYYSDIRAIDTAISNEPCFLGINPEGFLYDSERGTPTGVSIHDGTLHALIHRMMPRTKAPQS